ncbi:pyridoxal 5'-phosphate synthase glutaminase subunit PdxT [Falsarthrobacter nasiphocae]|uniref:Pyridoxal 5'-phosphate synthase subunit PdxT n=1 Tax=Falsarthrobacter nasiphocae TaxID=189863 RepID=A0AAE4C919_9MICC|nr:pyridoxal 5'-phosphate synthase glutaminase subunit PdxT [Falsarthrobacter nasiphocae]MDR6892960.1 5'-phosphate synthase pdxT subunit [Falsarthrobacter nasiphocae]
MQHSGAPLVGVLAVQGDVREHEQFLQDVGARTRRIRTPRDLEGIEGLVLPGGESTAMAKLCRVLGIMDPIRELIREGLPVYGSCAGLILLADRIKDPALDAAGCPQETFGGLDVTVVRNAFGRQRESFEVDLEFAGLEPDPVHAVFIRAPQVLEAGPGVEVLARVGGLGRAAGRIVGVRSGNLLATSFHPEVTQERRIHELFMHMIAKR